MAFSSNVGFLLPCRDGSLLDRIYERVDSIVSFTKTPSLGIEVVHSEVVRRWMFFKRTVTSRRHATITRASPDFDRQACATLASTGFLSLWNVPAVMNALMLDGSAEKQNTMLWTPEDVGIGYADGGCTVELGDESRSFLACKIYIWGYGYFFPHSIRRTIEAVSATDSFKDLHAALKDLLTTDAPTIEACAGEVGEVMYLPGFDLPIFAEQSL